ncbi:MAG: EAL domain-containing protein [Treponema sp.]|nr:EAL domain-containing protein [Treponema sp.]
MILFLCMYALLTVALVFSLVFTMRHARSSNNDATKKTVPIMAVAVVAVASYTAFLASDGYYVAMFFNTVYYICTIWMTFFLLRFSYSYVGMPGKLPFERVLAVLGVVDSLSLLVNLFTYHSYDLVMMVYSLYHQYWGLAFTPLHYLHLGFCYVMVASSFVLLLVGAARAPSFYKQKFLFILGGYMLVIVANFISYTFNSPIDFSVLLYAVMAGFICFYTAYTFPHRLVTYLLDNVNEKIEDGLVFFDEHGGYVYSNERARRLLSDGSGGFSPSAAEEYAKAWKSVHPEEEKNGRDSFNELNPVTHELEEQHYVVEYQTMKSDGIEIGSFFKFVNKTKETVQYLKEKYNATHDELTGLYNRIGFFEKVMDVQFSRRMEEDEKYLMLFSNIRDFKLVNETFDTSFGDDILKTIAKLLKENMSNDTVAGRIGDDKFVLYMRKSNFSEEIFVKGFRQLFSFTTRFQYKPKVMVGIYESTMPNENPQLMCDKAQMACDKLAKDYQHTFAWYDKALMEKADAEKNIVDEFDQALENGQFKIYLQPQLADAGTEKERYFGAEVLVCWEHPVKGTLYPDDFLPTLEKTGLVYKLDCFVWEEAAKKLSEWNKKGFKNQSVSVNISQKDIYYIDVYKTFVSLVEKYGIEPHQLNIEISESGFMSDFELSKKLFESLQDFGFKVEIDDFGSGYSSLNMLKDIHADVLKIGRSFLNESDNSERSNTILCTIINMAKDLGMDVLAVGVESEDQMNLLKTLGCESFQGFYFSKPVPVESFERMYL